MTSRVVVFDLDGTLVDTLGTIAAACNHALGTLELPTHPVDSYRTMVGDGVRVLCRRALPADRSDLEAELVSRILARYDIHVLDGAVVYPGIVEMLEELRRRTLALGVLSNKPHSLTLATLEGLDLDGFFAATLGQSDDVPPKPDPTGVQRLLAELQADPAITLYVGDTSTDMETAQVAGLISVGVLWGFRGADELRAHGARHLIETPDQLVDLVDRLRG